MIPSDLKPWEWRDAWEFFAAASGNAPLASADACREACIHGRGSDVERDLPLLWCVAMAMQAPTIIELGVRQGVMSRTLAHAANLSGGMVQGFDPDPRCAYYLQELLGPALEQSYLFYAMTGEAAWEQRTEGETYELLVIDTDPHDYKQTRGWLETWVQHALAPGGVAVFHDIVPARPEIEVERAILEFIHTRAAAWRYVPVHTPGPCQYRYGLGLLWRLP